VTALDSHVLVLNRLWQPVNTCTARRAVTLVFLGHAHIVHRDKGGKTSWENVVASCIRCNSKKANKMPHEARMFPRTAPRAPRWRPFHASLQNTEPRTSWRDFIEVADGTVEISA
jgi:hypothetical protein